MGCTPTHIPTSAVHVDGSTTGGATKNIINTPEAAYRREQEEACFSGNGVADLGSGKPLDMLRGTSIRVCHTCQDVMI